MIKHLYEIKKPKFKKDGRVVYIGKIKKYKNKRAEVAIFLTDTTGDIQPYYKIMYEVGDKMELSEWMPEEDLISEDDAEAYNRYKNLKKLYGDKK